MDVLFFGGIFFEIRPIDQPFSINVGENSIMKRKRPDKRRRCIGRRSRRKGTVGGGKSKSARFKRQNFSPPEPPALRVRTQRRYRPMQEQVTDLTGESIWRDRRIVSYLLRRPKMVRILVPFS